MSVPLEPPAFAERSLRLLIGDPEWRDAVSGDMREEFASVARRRGPAAARAWYWRQALHLTGRFAAGRVLRRRDLMRPWSPSTDFEDTGGWRRGWLRDVRHAARAIGRRPSLAAVVALTLGLALAANATIYGLIDALVLRPYRFAGVDRLILVASDSPSAQIVDRESVSALDFKEWRESSRTVSELAAVEWWNANLSEVETPELLPAFKVTPNFFTTLSVQPVLGRLFTKDEEEPGNHRRVVLSHVLWTRKFGADRTIIGRTIRMDGEPFDVLGVAPPGFQIPFGSEIWAPIRYDAKQWSDRGPGSLNVIGRLAGDATVGAARSEFNNLVADQRRRYPDTHAKREVTVMTFNEGLADPGAGLFLRLWQIAALLLLFIACANIANLLLARGAERMQEFSLRRALGGSRWRITGQLLIEGGMLAALGVLASVPLAAAGIALSRNGIPPSVVRFVPGIQFMRVDDRVLLLTAVLGAIATLAFSILPALHASRAALADTLRESGRTQTASRRRQWVRNSLAAAQVALTLALLFGSGLMLAGADRTVNGALGFDKHNLLTAQLVLPDRPYAEAETRRQFIDRVLTTMRAIPAATDVAFTSAIPYGQSNPSRTIFPEGQTIDPQEARSADYRRISPTLLATLKNPMVAGRGFTDADREGTLPVAIVTQNFAERYWPDQDAVGKRFRTTADGPWLTIVGVSADFLHNWFNSIRRPTYYVPYTQDAPMTAMFAIRTIGDPLSLAGDLRRAVAAADPNQPISKLQSMEEVIHERTGGILFLAKALAAVALIALVLAIAGVYSLMAYSASQRTKEIGVHLALGAGWWQVIRLTTGQALRVTVAGTVIGAVMAAGVGQVMQSSLVGAVSNDFWTLGILIVLLVGVALLAAYLPARRAANLDPTTALRAD
jgi:putative ABC transport system permease protein